MDVNKILRIGDVIELEYNKQIYKSSIQDIITSIQILIALPTFQGKITYILPNTVLNMTIFRKECLYTFRARMEQAVYKDNMHFLCFTVISFPYRINRRNSFRLDISMLVKARYIGPFDDTSQSEIAFEGITNDISEGGISIKTTAKYPEGGIIVMELNLDGNIMELTGIIKSCVSAQSGKFKYLIKIAFDDYSYKDKQTMNKFIMQEQIKRRI